MSGFFSVLFMSVLLAAASFGIGILPLSFAFSKPALAKVSALGTGLLLGAALGVIIPEGIEALVQAPGSPDHAELPTTAIALALLGGFTFMLLVEQFLAPHAPPALSTSQPHTRKPSAADGPATVEFDAELELGELERAEGITFDAGTRANADPRKRHRRSNSVSGEGKARAVPLTLGLVVHALADGLALGSSALSDAGEAGGASGTPGAGSVVPSGLSIVVFLALVIHKAPTALALTTSLLSTPLSRTDCKKHIAAFSLSTPLGALASYALLSWFEFAGSGRVPGVAMLVSGGTFLYVATVLRPIPGHGHAGEEDMDAAIGPKTRTLFVLLGMFVPVAIGALVGHDHGHGA